MSRGMSIAPAVVAGSFVNVVYKTFERQGDLTYHHHFCDWKFPLVDYFLMERRSYLTLALLLPVFSVVAMVPSSDPGTLLLYLSVCVHMCVCEHAHAKAHVCMCIHLCGVFVCMWQIDVSVYTFVYVCVCAHSCMCINQIRICV